MLTQKEFEVVNEIIEVQKSMGVTLRLHSLMLKEIFASLRDAGLKPIEDSKIDEIMKEFDK